MSRIMAPFSWPVASNGNQTKNSRIGNPLLQPLTKDSIHFGMAKLIDSDETRWRVLSEILNDERELLPALDTRYWRGFHKFFLGQLEDSVWASENHVDVDTYVQEHEKAILLVSHILGLNNFKALLGYGLISGLNWVSLPALVEHMEVMLQKNDFNLIELLVQAAQLCKKVNLSDFYASTDNERQLLDLARLENIISITSRIHTEPDKSRKDRGKRLLREAAAAPDFALQDLLTWQHQASR